MKTSTNRKNSIRRFFFDFRAFISKGNILDMAVGVIIGGAFGKIVTSLVNDIIMPLITLIVGGKSVDDWKWVITQETEDVAESAVYYGRFIQSILDFLIIALFIFLALRVIMNFKLRLRREEEGECVLSKKGRKALSKELRRQGVPRKNIAELIDKKEAELSLQRAAQKEQEEREQKEREQKELCASTKEESTDSILKDIRDLLQASISRQ